MDNQALIKEIITGFFSDIETKLETLHTAIKDSNYDDIVNITHDLKGASANLSFNRFSLLMKQ